MRQELVWLQRTAYIRGVSIGEAGRKPNRESEKDRVTEEYVETTQHTHSLPHRLETEKKTTKKRVQQIFFHFLFRLRTKTQTQTQTDRNGLSALYFIHANFLLVEFFAPLPFPRPLVLVLPWNFTKSAPKEERR